MTAERKVTATERKLRRKIFALAEDCYALAYTVLNNTAGEDQPEYDNDSFPDFYKKSIAPCL
jgi:hypothetical protein